MEKENKKIVKGNIKLPQKSADSKDIKINSKKISNENVKKEFILEGLDCANCAAKIEDKIRKIKGISSANVNFVTKTLTLEIEEINRTKELIAATAETIVKMEPDVKLVEKKTEKVIRKVLMLEGVG